MVMPTIWKTATLCLVTTMILSIPLLVFPYTFLEPLLRKTGEADLITEALPVLRLLLVILVVFSIGSVYFHALASMGAAALGLGLQVVSAFLYLALFMSF